MAVTTAAELLKLGADVIEPPRVGERIDLVEVSTPLFAGFAPAGSLQAPALVESFQDFSLAYGRGDDGPFMASASLAHTVRGFFLNGGARCWVLRLPESPSEAGVGGAELAAMLTVPCSIIAVPDVHGLAGGAPAALGFQRELVERAQERGGRIVVLDPPPGLAPEEVPVWRRRLGVESPNAVVYYPWVEVPALPTGQSTSVPPSGHAVGSWGRLDVAEGVHHAPTGQPLLGIDALATTITAADQRSLNRIGVNCLRAFPGPEARIWGASTLAEDADWRYLHRRRTYQQLMLSIALGTSWVAEAGCDDATLERLQAAVASLLQAAWRRGALYGATTGQAFSVSCEASVERPGHIALELALALRQPGEFRTVKLTLATATAI